MTTMTDSKEEIFEMMMREGFSEEAVNELWETWHEYHGESYPPVNWAELADSVYGHYDSKEDFAQEYAEAGCYNMDENLKDYIDWSRFADDLLGQHYYMGSNGWVIIL